MLKILGVQEGVHKFVKRRNELHLCARFILHSMDWPGDHIRSFVFEVTIYA